MPCLYSKGLENAPFSRLFDISNATFINLLTFATEPHDFRFTTI
jgi:hypothetical protein